MFHEFTTDDDTIHGSFSMTKSNLKIMNGLNRNELGPLVGQIKTLSLSNRILQNKFKDQHLLMI